MRERERRRKTNRTHCDVGGMEVEGGELQKEKVHGKQWENKENGAIKKG